MAARHPWLVHAALTAALEGLSRDLIMVLLARLALHLTDSALTPDQIIQTLDRIPTLLMADLPDDRPDPLLPFARPDVTVPSDVVTRARMWTQVERAAVASAARHLHRVARHLLRGRGADPATIELLLVASGVVPPGHQTPSFP